jgi:hypothetical protein
MTNETVLAAPTAEEASTNFYWTFGREEKFNLQTTVRGALTPGQIKLHLAAVKAALTAAVELGGHAKAVGRAVLEENSAAAMQTVSAPAGNGWTPPAPTGPVSMTVAGGGFASAERLTIIANKLEIAPRADGKVDLKWYAPGHQYPDIYMTRTVAETLAALRPTGEWLPEHLSKAEEYPVSHAVDYTLSAKLNKNNKPYKDIVAVRPA